MVLDTSLSQPSMTTKLGFESLCLQTSPPSEKGVFMPHGDHSPVSPSWWRVWDSSDIVVSSPPVTAVGIYWYTMIYPEWHTDISPLITSAAQRAQSLGQSGWSHSWDPSSNGRAYLDTLRLSLPGYGGFHSHGVPQNRCFIVEIRTYDGWKFDKIWGKPTSGNINMDMYRDPIHGSTQRNFPNTDDSTGMFLQL